MPNVWGGREHRIISYGCEYPMLCHLHRVMVLACGDDGTLKLKYIYRASKRIGWEAVVINNYVKTSLKKDIAKSAATSTPLPF